jgi:hypothetical protein
VSLGRGIGTIRGTSEREVREILTVRVALCAHLTAKQRAPPCHPDPAVAGEGSLILQTKRESGDVYARYCANNVPGFVVTALCRRLGIKERPTLRGGYKLGRVQCEPIAQYQRRDNSL